MARVHKTACGKSEKEEMTATLLERDFEADIENWLCESGGYEKGEARAFDRQLCLDAKTLIDFVRATQPKEWERHVRNYQGDAERAFIARFNKEVSNRSLLDVLRNGVKDRGVSFRLVFWKPETALNPEAIAAYEANRLHCVRQLRYSPANENSVDIAILLNGIPIIALELKNPLTGQTVEDAMRQYREDRSPSDLFFAFKKRCLACFAVDPYRAKMTTRLAGPDTLFLPFDQGSGGAGNVGGAGNPASGEEGEYPVAHLWKSILAKDSLLQILQRYAHLQKKEEINPETGEIAVKESLIFPRYHQWDATRKLLCEARQKGAGHNYLIQHSAGSGKSNSIAWLAHGLSGLHNADNQKIFASVIVVTDRRVLDSQLQATVSQFERTGGLVCKVDKNSAQLRDAINGGAAIIVTTLQKFPVIFQEVKGHKANFAIIVDEAHSSQSGQAALKLKAALADTDAALEEYAQAEMREEDAEDLKRDEFWLELAAQGRHRNLSFFAFTATPKAKTLELFGHKDAAGKYAPFHIYSMRQAIEEGFILDPLRNYVTYGHYYKLARAIADDPRYATAAGTRAAMLFESLHPHNIAQKTAVMLSHFCGITANKIGGRAKAMLVTPSRLHAVRYAREFTRQIKEKKLACARPLVAFSGEVDDGGEIITEPGLNERIHGVKITEAQLPDAFAKDFNILIVAEKYQTGFDEPLLHTMFVDKPLADVKAVQTLSRVNRVARGKEDTFILDFANTADSIKKAFQPYYEAARLEEETDPNMLYDIKARLDGWGVYEPAEADAVASLASRAKSGKSLIAAAISLLAPVLARYRRLPEEKRPGFRTALFRFNRLYGFISQLVRMFDADLHGYYFFCRHLARALPKEGDGLPDLSDQIDLEYYKLKKTGEGAIELEASDSGLAGIKGDSGGGKKDYSELSRIIEKINKRFGASFKPEDKVHILRQIVSKVANSDPALKDLALQNDLANWNMVYDKAFPDAVAESADESNQFFEIFSTQEALDELKGWLRDAVREENLAMK